MIPTVSFSRRNISGLEACNVNMNGLSFPLEQIQSFWYDSNPKIKTKRKNSIPQDYQPECIASPGALHYYCKCSKYFIEDQKIPIPNCLKFQGACDKRGCVHGTCITNSHLVTGSVCVCYPGYDGLNCELRVSHLSINQLDFFPFVYQLVD